MKSRILWCALLLSASAADAACVVPNQFWDRPRTAQRLIDTAQLQPCIHQLALDPGAKLLIARGAGEEASLRAEELRGWLIALGVDTARIGEQIRNDSADLSIEIVKQP